MFHDLLAKYNIPVLCDFPTATHMYLAGKRL